MLSHSVAALMPLAVLAESAVNMEAVDALKPTLFAPGKFVGVALNAKATAVPLLSLSVIMGKGLPLSDDLLASK